MTDDTVTPPAALAATGTTASVTTEAAASSVLQRYQTILSTHFKDPASIQDALSTTVNHALWEALADWFQQEHSDESLQAVLNAVHAQQGSLYPLLPLGTMRQAAKRVARVRDKIAPCPAHRSNFCDWMACRILARYDQFVAVKEQLVTSLPRDTVVVWRHDYDNASSNVPPDIMHMGYAFRPGALAVLEIQVVEPIAAWIFTSNSLHKHVGVTGRVTFKESKVVYNACKEAILNHTTPTDEAVHDVVAYYQSQRQDEPDAAPLDIDALQTLQTLIQERFFSSQRKEGETSTLPRNFTTEPTPLPD